MTSSAYILPFTPAPKGLERDVRRMLRLIKRRHRLESLPIGRSIAAALGTKSVYEGVLRLMDRTFADSSYMSRRLRELIWKTDVEANLTQAGVAFSMHLSPRQYFRYRSEAVIALCNAISALMTRSSNTADPIAALAHLTAGTDPETSLALLALSRSPAPDARLEALVGAYKPEIEEPRGGATPAMACSVAFLRELAGERAQARTQLERIRNARATTSEAARALLDFHVAAVEFEMARHDGYAPRLVVLALRARELAGENADFTNRALLMECEAGVKTGAAKSAADLMQLLDRAATESRDLRTLGITTLRKAQLAFLAENLREAHDLASAAQIVLTRLPYESTLCKSFADRVRLLSGHATDWTASYPAPHFARIWQTGIAARAALQSGDMAQARALAQNQYNDSAHAGYAGMQGWAAATLAAVAYASADESSGDLHARKAWVQMLACGDALNARDAFAPAQAYGPERLHALFAREFVSVVGEALQERFAGVRLLDDARLRPRLVRALQMVVGAVMDDRPALSAPLHFFEALRRRGISAADFGRQQAAVKAFVAWSAGMLAPFGAQGSTSARIALALDTFYRDGSAHLSLRSHG